MIQISDESMRMLMDRVKSDKIEVHIEFTTENTSIDIQPWEPIKLSCPYACEVKNEIN